MEPLVNPLEQAKKMPTFEERYEESLRRQLLEGLIKETDDDEDSEYYEEAIRILKFLKGFINIPSEHVPNLSVLREFIGGGYYGH